MEKDKRIVVITGARGNLARLLTARFERAGWGVRRVSRGGQDGFEDWKSVFEHGLLEGAEAIIHCAWSTVPATSEVNPGIEWSMDLPLLSQLLCETGRTPQPPRFIFLSSGGTVYGDAGTHPSCEDDACRPKGWYGAAKLAAEGLVQEFAHRQGLSTLILRPSNPYGFDVPDARPQGLIPHLVHSMRESRRFVLWGDGNAMKDYLHSEDFSEAVFLAVKEKHEGLLNISHGESFSVSDIVKVVESHLGTKADVVMQPAPHWDVQRSLISNERAKTELAWSPEIGFENGIRRAVDAMVAISRG